MIFTELNLHWDYAELFETGLLEQVFQDENSGQKNKMKLHFLQFCLRFSQADENSLSDSSFWLGISFIRKDLTSLSFFE